MTDWDYIQNSTEIEIKKKNIASVQKDKANKTIFKIPLKLK